MWLRGSIAVSEDGPADFLKSNRRSFGSVCRKKRGKFRSG
jgi:hypothetical protein